MVDILCIMFVSNSTEILLNILIDSKSSLVEITDWCHTSSWSSAEQMVITDTYLCQKSYFSWDHVLIYVLGQIRSVKQI